MTLADPFGRPVEDLRVSVTAACDLRCWFCHHEGMLPRRTVLEPDGFVRVARAAASLGVRYVKLTGGEPLLNPHLATIVAGIAPHVEEVSLVTNGRHLPSCARELKRAGLRRVNVSLHTVDAPTYARLTGGRLSYAVQGVEAAVEAGLSPVKVNVVATPPTLERLDELVSWARGLGVGVQLIELHAPPTTPPGVADGRATLAEAEASLAGRASQVVRHRLHGRHRYVVDGVAVEVTRPQGNPAFCAGCTRLRLTHDGFLKPCLMRADNLVDARPALEPGAPPELMNELIRKAVERRAPFWTAGQGVDAKDDVPVLAR